MAAGVACPAHYRQQGDSPPEFVVVQNGCFARSPTVSRGSYGEAVDGDRTQVLLVDLGGVLFGFDHGHSLDVLGECLGMPPGRVDELLWQSGFSAARDTGRYRDAAAIRAQVRRITGYADADEHLDAAWCAVRAPVLLLASCRRQT
jgi:hypothetical protein